MSPDTLGWILYKRGDYQGALVLLQESADKLPDNAEVHYHLGMVQYKLKDNDGARKALARALEKGTNFPGIEEARRTIDELR